MVRAPVFVLLALLVASSAGAVVLEVRRVANVVDEPNSSSTRIARLKGKAADPIDVLLVGLERENGYYRIFVPDSDEIAGFTRVGAGYDPTKIATRCRPSIGSSTITGSMPMTTVSMPVKKY